MAMKIFVCQNRLRACLFMMFIGCLIFSGCRQYGPSLPFESIDETLSDELRPAVSGLYNRDPEDVLLSVVQLTKMGPKAVPAVPYLASMLADRRIAKEKVYGFAKSVPLFKAVAMALGSIGEEGVVALVDSLKGLSQHEGIDDDFIREAVAEGLKAAKKQLGTQPFKKMCTTDRVLYMMDAITACLTLQAEPGLFDKSDPRENLKFYKHFSAVSAREGLDVFIEALGNTGDERALSLLSGIVPLSAGSPAAEKVDIFCRFQRAAAIAQFKIRPVAVKELNPLIAKVLFLTFIAEGDVIRVGKMLDGGMDPDTTSVTGEPAISFAFKKGYPDIFKRLVKSGASIDYSLSKKDTLLIRAAAGGDDDFVQLLLENGADPARVNNAKETAAVACFKALVEFWDGKPGDKKAEPYLRILTLLRKAGSPQLPEKMLKPLDKKMLKILKR